MTAPTPDHEARGLSTERGVMIDESPGASAAAAAAEEFVAAAVTPAGRRDPQDADVVSLRFEGELGLAALDQAGGELEAAERRLVEALVEARTIAGGERSVLLLTDALATTYKLGGRLADAQSCYDEVYDLLQASAPADSAALAGLFRNLAGLAYLRGEAANGLLWAERGVVIRSQLGDTACLDLARDYGGLGALQQIAGRLEEAGESYRRAEAGMIAALGPDHREVRLVRNNLNGVLASRNPDPKEQP